MMKSLFSMAALHAAATLSILVNYSAGSPTTKIEMQKRAEAYANPLDNGGSMLTQTNAASGGLGEPLNVIISGDSDAQVLTQAGIVEYLESLYFSQGACLNISLGGPQQADLGDGKGYVDQTDVFRFNYYSGDTGTCIESLNGGNHLRYWSQNGSSADTNAVFMAVSYEYNSTLQHDIVPDGYDLGRNLLVNNATNSSGTTSPGGFKYSTTMSSAALLTSYTASQINHDIGVDGNVAILTVRVTQNGTLGANRNSGPSSSSTSSSTGGSSSSGGSIQRHSLFVLAIALLWTGCILLL